MNYHWSCRKVHRFCQLLLTLITISTAAQAQFGYFTDSGCATLVVGGPSSNAEDCCVNNTAGLYYNDGGQCFQCIVYGFGSDTFTRPEVQYPYDVPLAYFKGPSNAQLKMAIDYNGEGTASEEEFSIGQSVVSLPLNPGRTTSITFQADRVALEPDETFVLELSLLSVANGQRGLFDSSSLPNVFFRSRQEFIIQDRTVLDFRLRDTCNRFVDEDDRFITIEVTVTNEVELASDISLVLTPMIAADDFTPLPTTRPFARANTIEGRIDFFTAPITLDFVAGGEIHMAGDVLINDDLIDEALEYFVVTLTFQDPDNVPPSASIESNGGDIIRIDIIDNDDIFIGFALPSTTYPEVEADHQIQIIKGAGNVTEQTISFVIYLFQTAPPGLETATPSAGKKNNDFSFPSSTLQLIGPEENEEFVDVTIFEDELPEVTEAAQLRLRLPTDVTFPGFKILPQYPEFFIIIDDDDSTQCEELPPLRNGSILYHIGTTFLGTIAMYTCDDGFFLDGDNERNCTTGEVGSRMTWAWTGQEPRCVPLCNDLPPLANGMIIYNVSEEPHRTVAMHTCDKGFQLLGDEIRTCEDGVWAEASPLQCAQEGAVIGAVIGSLALLLALLVAIILVVVLKYRKYKSKISSINENNAPDMKPEIVLDELTHHDYDYISVFQEANLKSKSTTGNPQPSTAGDGALEVQFKLSPCDAYGPVTGPMDEDMYS